MVAFMGPPVAAFALDDPPRVTSDGLIFDLDEVAGTAEVYRRSDASLEVHIPETVMADGRTYTVTSIGWGAFHSAGLTSVTMPNTITVIDVGAFYKNEIEHIQLSSSLKTINRQAFRESGLTSLELPDSLVSIGDTAFYGTSLGAVALPDSLQTLEDASFRDAGITSLVLPESLTIIPFNAFADNRLTNLVLPDTVTAVGDHAFIRNPLTSLKLSTSLKTLGWNVFYDNKLTSVTVPRSVTVIEKFAFTTVHETLRTIHFEGNAPTVSVGGQWGASLGYGSDLRVTYNYGAAGFKSPVWQGYAAEPLSTEVTFDSREGTAVVPVVVPLGVTLVNPAPPTRTGYTFNGWYTEDTVATPYDFAAPVTGPLTLYAGWTADAYTVTWHENLPGSGAPTVEVVNGQKLTALPEPAAAGWVISGWNTRPDGTGKTVNTDTLLGSVASGADLALYAIWEKRALSLTFAPGSATSTTATAGDTVTLTATANGAFGSTLDVSDEVRIVSTVASDVVSKTQVVVTSAGSRSLTGTFDGASAAVELNVVAGPLGTLALTSSSGTIEQGGTLEFTVTGADASGNPVAVDAANVTLTSNVTGDVVDGTEIEFPTAGVRQITATVLGVSAAPVTIDITVSPRYVVAWNENWPDAGAPTTGVVNADRLSELPDPSAAGWVISNWNTRPDGSGTPVDTGTLLQSVASGPNLTLYAIWEKRTLSLTVPAAKAASGTAVELTALANAAFGKSVDVTAEVQLVSSEDSDKVTGATVLVTKPGPRTFTATYDGATATANLDVVVGALANLTLTPSSSTVARGGSLEFAVSGVDAAGNPLRIDPADVTLSSDVATDVVSGLTVTFPTASPHRITATVQGIEATVTIEVQGDDATIPVDPTESGKPTPQPNLAATGSPLSTELAIVAALLVALGALVVGRRRRLDAK